MMGKIKRIGVASFARLQAVLFALLGVVAGVIYAFGGMLCELVTGVPLNTGTALAFLALIGMPLIFAIGGFGLGLIEAALYNLVSEKFGGMELDLE